MKMGTTSQLSAGVLQMANQAMRNGDYCRAIALYIQHAALFQELGTMGEFNTALARRRGLSSLPAEDRLNPKKRAAIFASYSRTSVIEDYILHYLRHLRKVANYIVMVSDYHVDDPEKAKLDGLVDQAIFKHHGEYDFGSYKRGYQHLFNSRGVDDFDELILCNDSCYGPLQDFSWIFFEMSSRPTDFWGLTQNSEFGNHLQSFFLVFNKKVFCSEAFRNFILSVKKEKSVQDVILNYEVDLSRVLSEAGFSWDSFINPDTPGMKKLLVTNANPTVFPVYLIKQGVQLVKVKATRDQSCNFDGIQNILKLIAKENKDLFRCINQHGQAVPLSPEDEPFFSMILPVFNRNSRVTVAINSVLAQGYKYFELIVVDDGSTDDTTPVICQKYAQAIQEGRLRVIRYEENAGVSAARNIGLAAARGSWIAYIDSDNTLRDGFFRVFANAIRAYPDLQCFYAKFRRNSSETDFGLSFDYEQLLRENFIDLGVFVHQKSVGNESGGFDCQLKRLVDWDFVIRATRHRTVKYIPELVLNYDDNSFSTDRISVNESYDIALKIIREKHGIPFSVTCIIILNDNTADLEDAFSNTCTQDSGFTYQILVFDNSHSDETWQLIQCCAMRYPHLIKACKQEKAVSDLHNLLDAIGTVRSDFVAFLAAGDSWVTSTRLKQQAQFLIDNPELSMILEFSGGSEENSGAAFPRNDIEVAILSRRMYRRHVLERLRGQVLH